MPPTILDSKYNSKSLLSYVIFFIQSFFLLANHFQNNAYQISNFSFDFKPNQSASSNPSLSIPYSNTVCLNTNFSFAVIPNTYLNYILISSNGDTLLTSTTNTFNIPITSTTQTDTYSVIVIDITGQYTLSFNIYVLAPFDFSNALIVSPNFSVCYGKTVNIQPINTSPYVLTSPNLNFNTNYTVTAPIPFTVIASYSNTLGYSCTYTNSYTIFPIAALNTSISQKGYTLCSLETATYVTYQWKDCTNNSEIFGATQPTFSPLQAGSFYVKLYSPYCVDSSECKSINPNAPIVNVKSTPVTCIEKNNGTIKIDYFTPYYYVLDKTDWNPDICDQDTCLFLTGLSAGIYTIELKFKHQYYSSLDTILTYSVVVKDNQEPCVIRPFNSVVIGNNGYFHIDGISEFTENEVYIFSRWGNKIADIKNYNNYDRKWPEKNASVNPGTYYYIININDKSKPIKGWLEVIE